MDTFHLICESMNQVRFNNEVSAFRKKISAVTEECQRSIKNGPNYPQQVAVCTNMKKIVLIKKLIGTLQRYASVPGLDRTANTLLIRYKQLLMKCTAKLINARKTLVKRQRTIPVAMSNKPSPERYNPRREARGKE